MVAGSRQADGRSLRVMKMALLVLRDKENIAANARTARTARRAPRLMDLWTTQARCPPLHSRYISSRGRIIYVVSGGEEAGKALCRGASLSRLLSLGLLSLRGVRAAAAFRR
jgi:hypothetical protein